MTIRRLQSLVVITGGLLRLLLGKLVIIRRLLRALAAIMTTTG